MSLLLTLREINLYNKKGNNYSIMVSVDKHLYEHFKS
jgi:hypothetical protein